MKNLLLVLLIVLAGSVQAGVYKCKVNGQTVYQQLPCDEGGEQMKVRPGPSSTGPSDSVGLRPGELDLVREAELNDAARRGKIKIGMTPKQVRRAWGRPDKINRTVGANIGVNEQCGLSLRCWLCSVYLFRKWRSY